MQGYLPVALLVNAIKAKKPLAPGFYNAGTQLVTADSVDMGNGLPAVTFDQAQAMAADPAATAAYYKPWTAKLTPDMLNAAPAADRRRVRVSRRAESATQGRPSVAPFFAMTCRPAARLRPQSRQALWRRGGDRRHEPRRRARHDPRGGRRERRRQIDADEGARRRRQAGRRHHPARRRGGRRSTSPAAARRRGIGIVFQELSLFPERSVLANLFVNREPGRYGIVSTRAMEETSRETLDRLGLSRRRPCAGEPAQHRRTAARRTRPRAPRGAAPPHPRRAQLGAEPARDGTAVRDPEKPVGARRRPCSTCRIGWRRFSPSPTGSRSPATAATCFTADIGDLTIPRGDRRNDRRAPGGRCFRRRCRRAPAARSGGFRRQGPRRQPAPRHRPHRRGRRGGRARRPGRIGRCRSARHSLRDASAPMPARSAIPTAAACREVRPMRRGGASAWSRPTAGGTG